MNSSRYRRQFSVGGLLLFVLVCASFTKLLTMVLAARDTARRSTPTAVLRNWSGAWNTEWLGEYLYLVNVIRQEILPAHEQGDALLVLTKSAPVMSRLTDAQLSLLNWDLDDRGKPRLMDMIIDARLRLLEQNLAEDMPAVSAVEQASMAPYIAARVEQVIEESAAIVLDNAPPDHRNYAIKELADEIDRLQTAAGRLDAAIGWARYGQQETAERPIIAVSAIDFPVLIERASMLHRKVLEREAALRLAQSGLSGPTGPEVKASRKRE